MTSYQYTIKRGNRRTIAIHILPDLTLEVRAPHRVKESTIAQFVQDHHDWIDKKLSKLNRVPLPKPKTYTQGDTFLYLGSSHVLTLCDVSEISAKDGILHAPVGLSFRMKTELERWYKSEARRIITDQVDSQTSTMHTTHNGLRFSDTSSKWGSCKPDNSLQFNWRLVMAPLLVIRYVVIHELAHTIEKNHSRDFWDIVAAHNPSYKQQRKWLKLQGHTLIF